MEPKKDVALGLLKGMAGLEIKEEDQEEVGQIIDSGYGYGLQEGRYIGHLEYEYWALAQPLRRIIKARSARFVLDSTESSRNMVSIFSARII